MRVFCEKLKNPGFLIIIDPLQRGFIVNDNSGNFTIFNHGLFPNENNVTIIYSGPDHGIALCLQAEISLNVGPGFHIQINFFICHDRFPTGNVPQQRELLCFDPEQVIHGDFPVGFINPAHQIGRGGVQCFCKGSDFIPAHIGNHTGFPFSDRAFSNANFIGNLF